MNSQETEVTAYRDEAAFRHDYPLVWFLTLVGPFALTAGVVFVLFELGGRERSLATGLDSVRDVLLFRQVCDPGWQ